VVFTERSLRVRDSPWTGTKYVCRAYAGVQTFRVSQTLKVSGGKLVLRKFWYGLAMKFVFSDLRRVTDSLGAGGQSGLRRVTDSLGAGGFCWQ
jgi:hypothetical protein